MTQQIKRLVLESVLILIVGGCLGLAANASHDGGIDLGRDYYRKASAPVQKPEVAVAEREEASPPEEAEMISPPANRFDLSSIDQDVLERLAEQGLKPIPHYAVVEAHEDERFLTDQIVFVDARNNTAYEEGHIPGAYHLDHYFLEQCVDEVTSVCMGAEMIVLYCNGGDCQDSEYLAQDLLERGVEPANLYIYSGGIVEWEKNDLAMESGPRLSGEYVE